MEKLETLLQDMIVRKFGRRAWQAILEQSLALCDFDEHIESYGVQRVATMERRSPGPECVRTVFTGPLLLDSAAGLLRTTVPLMLEELGGSYARGLRDSVAPDCSFSSSTAFFSAAAFYFNTCSWILDAIIPGSLQVRTTADGRLNIQCSLRDDDLSGFLKGFLSEIQGGLDGPPVVIHSAALDSCGETVHSFTTRNGCPVAEVYDREECHAVAG